MARMAPPDARSAIEDGIDALVTVKRAGPFALAATVRSAKGEVVLSLTAPVTLAQDASMATIAIPGRDLHARGIDGPFTIDLTLMDASWAAVQLDQLTKAVTTDAYRAVDFSP